MLIYFNYRKYFRKYRKAGSFWQGKKEKVKWSNIFLLQATQLLFGFVKIIKINSEIN